MYWLCITHELSWNKIQKLGIWGMSRKVSKLKKGDKLVFYLKKEKLDTAILEPRLSGVFEVISDTFKDNTKIFNRNFAYRVKLKKIKIFDSPIEFKPLVPKLNFIKNKKNWGIHLQGKSMVELPEEDYNLILEEIK